MDSPEERVAAIAVRKAKKFILRGNAERAQRLLRHALSVRPDHGDALLQYGRYLESVGDVQNADHFYFKASRLWPHHPEALEHRKRLSPVLRRLDAEMLDRIRLGDSPLPPETPERYYEHLYHTLAIEGNTFTQKEIERFLERGVRTPERSAREHDEVLGIHDAFRHVRRPSVRRKDVTVETVLDIHRRVMGRVLPSIAGRFRTIPVYVGRHVPPARVGRRVHALVERIRESLEEGRHPVRTAAIAHEELVRVHPFEDGNGRTSRLLMNLVLEKCGYPAVLLRKEDRDEYFRNLEWAREGHVLPFVRFIARSAKRTLDSLREEKKNLACEFGSHRTRN